MAENESELKFDEMERDRLNRVVSALEAAIAASTPASRGALERGLNEARGRVQILDKKIADSRTEHEARSREQAALAITIAEREARLNTAEKQTFAGFLQKDFFTKSDFGSLESFYTKTWDRLSDRGKDEMSRRVWEGVRRGEYNFTDLPKVVREKETEWAYTTLVKRQRSSAGFEEIPAKDREDFIRAYESGWKEEAQKVLERDSFKQNMFRSAESKGVQQASVEIGRAADGNNVERIASVDMPKPANPAEGKSGGKAEMDLSGFNLEGAKLSEAPPEISSLEIKTATASTSKDNASLGRT
jgi:hypothetical protein